MEEDLTRLGTKEIAKRLRQTFKKRYPGCKFSITSQYYSGGSSLNLAVMKADFKITKAFKDISQDTLDLWYCRHSYEISQIKEMQERESHQLNQFALRDEYDEDAWCNGVFLTEKGHKFLQEVMKEVYQYHYDRSDAMTDYFDTNFYIHLNLGKWDKPFIQEVV